MSCPAGFIHALAFPLAMSVMNRDDFPLPLLGMIHLENRVVQSAPVLFTEALDIRAWAENLRGHRAGTQLDVVAEVRARGGGRRPLARVSRPTWPRACSCPGSTSPRPPSRAGDVLGAGSHRAVAAGRRHGAGLRRRVRRLQPDPPERPLGQGPGHAAVHCARHVPGVAGRWRTSAPPRARRSAGTWPSRRRCSCRPAWRWTSAPSQDATAAWQRSDYVAWNPRSGRRHFSGSVAAL